MPFYRKVAGAWKPITPFRKIAGVWKPITLWRKIAGQWKPMAWGATAAPVTLSATKVGVGGLNTALCTATPMPGKPGPFSYLWQLVSGDATVFCTSNNAASTSFTTNMATTPLTKVAVYRCRVTNNPDGEVTFTNNVTSTFTTT